jgi:hypothetical protein
MTEKELITRLAILLVESYKQKAILDQAKFGDAMRGAFGKHVCDAACDSAIDIAKAEGIV